VGRYTHPVSSLSIYVLWAQIIWKKDGGKVGKCTEPEFGCKRLRSPGIDSKESISKESISVRMLDEGLYVVLLHGVYFMIEKQPQNSQHCVSTLFRP
jgi:hypothetical protein